MPVSPQPRVRVVRGQAGAFAGAPIGPGCMSVLAPYEVPNLAIEGNDVLVNKPKVCAYRAPGAPQSMHAMECAIDDWRASWTWIPSICG